MTSANRTGTRRWRVFRERLIRERAHVCYWCGCDLDPAAKPGEPGAIEIDHIKPVRTHPELEYVPANCALACAPCNRAKGRRTETASVLRRSEAVTW